MAQGARSSKLEARSSRLKLAKGKRHSAKVGPGLIIKYRRGQEGSGTWSAKLLLPSGKYVLRVLGPADDYQDANGVDVLDFWQAQAKARELAEQTKAHAGVIIKPQTVGEAAQKYLAWFRQHRRSVTSTEKAINAHILPALGEIRLDELRSARIRSWLEDLAAKPGRLRSGRLDNAQKYRAAPRSADEKRARRATANRVFNVLRAILNRAFVDGSVADDIAWRLVKPFPKVDEARIRFLTDAEALRLVNACPPDLRALVRGALLTGARYGELVAIRAGDVDVNGARLYIAHAKSGKPRHLPLNAEGTALFRTLVTGKLGDELVFNKADGTPWGRNHYVRGLKRACDVAKVKPAISFHELRHTYASHLAQAAVDLLSISKLLGHADTRITSRHYAHLADRTLAAAVTHLPDFGGDTGALVVVDNVKGKRRKA